MTSKLQNYIAEYSMPAKIRKEYENEVEQWIKEGWLIPYDGRNLGSSRGLLLLMAVVQQNKPK